ncbi:hypothetical protein [Ectobacillus panaciterrae]|nr:hypothetical protein [Ectobacillus panaciterrae]
MTEIRITPPQLWNVASDFSRCAKEAAELFKNGTFIKKLTIPKNSKYGS